MLVRCLVGGVVGGALQSLLTECSHKLVGEDDNDFREDCLIIDLAEQTPSSTEELVNKAPQGTIIVAITRALTWGLTTVAEERSDETATEEQGEQQRKSLTARDEGRKVPLPSAATLMECEARVRRGCHGYNGKKSRMIVAGAIYGLGELDEGFHELFRQAFESDDGLSIPTDGTNVIPTVHARDLAAFCVEGLETSATCIIATDGCNATLAAIAKSIAGAFSTEKVSTSDGEGDPPAFKDALLLDLPMMPLQLTTCHLQWPNGIDPSSAKCLKEDFIVTRGLQPVRIVVQGLPAERAEGEAVHIANMYQLPQLTPTSLEEQVLPNLDEELRHEIEGERAGGALPPKALTRLVHSAMDMAPYCNLGFVLHGVPLDADCCSSLFTRVVEHQPTEMGEGEDDDSQQKAIPSSKGGKKEQGKAGSTGKKKESGKKGPEDKDAKSAHKHVKDENKWPDAILIVREESYEQGGGDVGSGKAGGKKGGGKKGQMQQDIDRLDKLEEFFRHYDESRVIRVDEPRNEHDHHHQQAASNLQRRGASKSSGKASSDTVPVTEQAGGHDDQLGEDVVTGSAPSSSPFQLVLEVVGPPRNYYGFQPSEGALDEWKEEALAEPYHEEEQEEGASGRFSEERREADKRKERIRRKAEEEKELFASRKQRQGKEEAEPYIRAVNRDVMPRLIPALLQVDTEKPVKPLHSLADKLLAMSRNT